MATRGTAAGFAFRRDSGIEARERIAIPTSYTVSARIAALTPELTPEQSEMSRLTAWETPCVPTQNPGLSFSDRFGQVVE